MDKAVLVDPMAEMVQMAQAIPVLVVLVAFLVAVVVALAALAADTVAVGLFVLFGPVRLDNSLQQTHQMRPYLLTT
jgi:hypothetical protein